MEYLKQTIVQVFSTLGSFLRFTFDTIRFIFHAPFDGKALLFQMKEIGVKSIPVGVVSSLFIGMVMALQLGVQMENVLRGISSFLGGGIALAMARELAPTLTSILIAGRVGAAISAEIGTMKVTEQIDALETLATNPIHYLSVPRFLATTLSLPLITVMSIVVGIIGGGIVSDLRLDVPFNQYITNAKTFVGISDIVAGVSKTFVFGAEIALIACYTGFSTTGGAAGVGKATIRAVVFSYMIIIISNYFLTSLLQLLNI